MDRARRRLLAPSQMETPVDPFLDRAKGRPFAPPQVETLNSPQVDSVMGLLTAPFAKALATQWHYRSCPCRLHSEHLAAYNPGGTLAVALLAAEAVRAEQLTVHTDQPPLLAHHPPLLAALPPPDLS